MSGQFWLLLLVQKFIGKTFLFPFKIDKVLCITWYKLPSHLLFTHFVWKLVAAWSVSMIYLLLINKKFWGSLIDMNHLFKHTWDQLFWTHWESFQKISPISFPCDTCFVIFPSNFLLLTIFSRSLFPTQSCTSRSKMKYLIEFKLIINKCFAYLMTKIITNSRLK